MISNFMNNYNNIVIEVQGEMFYQDPKELERRYQGKWNISMLADYAWLVKRDDTLSIDRKKTKRKRF